MSISDKNTVLTDFVGSPTEFEIRRSSFKLPQSSPNVVEPRRFDGRPLEFNDVRRSSTNYFLVGKETRNGIQLGTVYQAR